VLSVDLFGSHAFLFTCLGYLAGQLNRKWDESKVFNQMLITLGASVFFWMGMYVLYQLFGSSEYRFGINYIMFLQPFYTMLISPVMFFIGGWLMDVFRMNVEEF